MLTKISPPQNKIKFKTFTKYEDKKKIETTNIKKAQCLNFNFIYNSIAEILIETFSWSLSIILYFFQTISEAHNKGFKTNLIDTLNTLNELSRHPLQKELKKCGVFYKSLRNLVTSLKNYATPSLRITVLKDSVDGLKNHVINKINLMSTKKKNYHQCIRI